MNVKRKKIIGFLGSLSLLAVIVATPVSTTYSSNNIKSNTNHNVVNRSNQKVSKNFTEQKTAVSGDFLLNDQNAIELNNPIAPIIATSITTNAPRGFVTQIDTNISYINESGNTIYSINIRNDSLLSSYYNKYANCFVFLRYSFATKQLFLDTYNESNFQMIDTTYIETFTTSQTTPKYLLTPISESDGIIKEYYIVSQYKNITADKIAYKITLEQSGAITGRLSTTLTSYFGTDNSYDGFLSAVGFKYDNNYYLICLSYWKEAGVNRISIFKNGKGVAQEFAPGGTASANEDLINRNISDIHLSLNSIDRTIEITSIYNSDISHTSVISGKFTIANNDLTVSAISLKGEVNYEIYQGRIYGDYLYAFVGDVGYNGIAYNKKVIRLKLTDHNDGTWNVDGFKWDGSYTNPRIVLYDSQYDGTDLNEIVAQPFYQVDNNYSSFVNIFTLSNKNLKYIDGTKNVFAYSSMSKNLEFNISNQTDTYVENVSNDFLLNYFKNEKLFENNFTQYQINTIFTITKKTSPSDIIENNNGNIPAILTIDKAYNNDSYSTAAKSFDIIFTGFKTIIPNAIVQTNESVNLANKYPYLAINDNNIQNTIKEFIFNKVLIGRKDRMDYNDIQIDFADNSIYDNKSGMLVLNSIGLNKYYDNDGNFQTNPKIFTLENGASLEINVFKQVAGPTNLNNQTISVNGSTLASMTIIDAKDPINKGEILNWLNTNKTTIFNNLPVNSNISDFTIVSATSTIGEMMINLVIDKYFENNNFYSFVEMDQHYNNINITGFVIKNWQTTTKDPNKSVEGTLATLLPSEINIQNQEFKQFLFDDVIVDERKNVKLSDIEKFAGNADNIRGIYTLTSITLSLVTDSEGNIVNQSTTLSGFQYEIRGFKSNSLETSVNTNPQEPLPESLKNILAQKVLISISEFKNYIFNYVLIDRTNPKLLQETVIDSDSIVDPIYDNLNGTIKFKLRITNTVDINGNLTGQPKTFDEIITISGFKTILPTSLKANPTINAGNINVWGDDVLDTTYEPIIRNNFNSILTNLPDSFSGSNITSIVKVTVDNNTGTIYFNISINLYFRENDGLESISPELTLNNVAINGWKTNPFIILNNRVDVLSYEQNYASQFAGSAINSDAQITTLLQNHNFLKLICPDTQGLANNAFSANGIKIDNLGGEIKFVMNANGGQFHPNQNIVTLYGFRSTMTIANWISQISNLKGTATTRVAIEQDVLDQVWKSANNLLSPFGDTVFKSDILVSFNSSSSITIKFNTNNFIDNSANIVTTPTDITFNVNYDIIAPSNLVNNDWIYIVIFSITGVAGLIFLIWLIYVIIKKYRDKWFK